MNFKLNSLTCRKLILSLFFSSLLCGLSAGRLELKLENKSSSPVNINFAGSNFINSFAPFIIKKGESKRIETGLSDGYFIRLDVVDESANTVIDSVVVADNFIIEESFENYIPAAGNIPSFGCYFNNSERISVSNIYGIRSLTWLPLCSSDYGRIDLQIKNTEFKENQKNPAPSDNPVKFTLFAMPETEAAEEITINGSSSSSFALKENDFNLESRSVSGNVSLQPVLYTDKDISSRWADLIIHNYTFNTYILYSLINRNSSFQHISFDFKDSAGEGGIVFYPPHTQRRGAAFRFGAMRKKASDMLLFPSESERKSERYALLIGRQDHITGNILEYIPVEIHSSVYSGKAMYDGVNIKGSNGSAYIVKFTPVNVVFYPDIAADSDDMINSVRIPVDKKGAPLFKLEAMEKPEIKVTGASVKSAAEYEISAYSKSLDKMVKYKLILIAPPFLAGNTPGVYKPDGAISNSFSSGNFLRYPLHLYLIELNDNGFEEIITGTESNTGLPDTITGSIEYFISDEIR